jgi:Arc/MetJ-type ribon-helix-helix transcriptional regulator
VADTEKITINMSVVDLGQIDLLADEGFYSSRTDFIRTAIRNQLSVHSQEVRQAVTRKSMVVGALIYSASDLEKYRAKGEQLDCKVIGLLSLADDVTPELAQAVFRSLEVMGVFRASNAVREALADRMKKS